MVCLREEWKVALVKWLAIWFYFKTQDVSNVAFLSFLRAAWTWSKPLFCPSGGKVKLHHDGVPQWATRRPCLLSHKPQLTHLVCRAVSSLRMQAACPQCWSHCEAPWELQMGIRHWGHITSWGATGEQGTGCLCLWCAHTRVVFSALGDVPQKILYSDFLRSFTNNCVGGEVGRK